MTFRALVASFSLALTVAGAPVPAFAQETVVGASIGGRITDPQGAVVPGATVRARRVATNVSVAVDSDQSGRFRFPNLPTGEYEVTIHHDGFADVTTTLGLTAGSAFDLPVSLRLAEIGVAV